MGYPSLKIVEFISNFIRKNNDYENKACDVSEKEKQTRDVFYLINHKATSVFDLVQCYF